MGELPNLETALDTVIQDNETVIQVLGQEFLADWNARGNIPQFILVLTDKRLYQLGTYYDPIDAGDYRKKSGENVLAISELTGIGITEKTVSRWITIIGVALAVVGSLILLAGLIDGSVMGMSLGLFVGAVSMVVPGVLMLFHAKTEGGRKYLDVTHRDGVIAAACQPYAEADVAAFMKECAALIKG